MWETRGPAPGLGLAQLLVVESPRTMHTHPLGLLHSGEKDMATISCSPGVQEGMGPVGSRGDTLGTRRKPWHASGCSDPGSQGGEAGLLRF